MSEIDPQFPARLSGRVVSRGVANGKVYVLPSSATIADTRELDESDIRTELDNLERALDAVAAQLRSTVDPSNLTLSRNATEIIVAQLAILDDASFCDKVRARVVSSRYGAGLALRVVTNEYVDKLKAVEDAHIQEKAADLQDVCDQLLISLSGKTPSFDVPTGSVIVAREIWPTTILALSGFAPAAIITETGGWTSHSFILARELGIPSISGVKNATQRLYTGEGVLVDAVNGTIVVTPDEIKLSAARNSSAEASTKKTKVVPQIRLSDATTLEFLANVDTPDKCSDATAIGVQEIGLVRSEYLFDFDGKLPDEVTQDKKYREIADTAVGRPIAIRTFDMSIGQIIAGDSRRERNPALGMRSIRLTLRYERQFRTQLRSLLRSNTGGNVSIVIPMVSGAADVVRVRALLQAEFESVTLTDPGIQFPLLGAMIELPSAVLTIDQVLEEVDFVCIGTNDLVQYTLGVDRDNEAVADWYQTLHPSILRSIKSVMSAAANAHVPATVCGEIAGSPFYLPLLIGLGVRRLSMNPSSISSMINYARSLDVVECHNLTEKLLSLSFSSEIEKALGEFCFHLWPELSGSRVNFPPAITPKF